MNAAGSKKRPKPNRRKRQTSFTIDQEVWDRLKEIERKTTAKPSSMVNKLLRECLRIAPQQKS
jgi:hypothetical protein